ncbi:MAG: class I SAM-dependent methyltransferase [Alphaproteobacteria bacterium]|nr:class I SAM-dependent methyltransferase [Alphaproteobacteria bacterium]
MKMGAMKEFDQFKDSYSDKIGEAISFSGQSHDFYIRIKADHLLRAIKKNFYDKESITFLDVGCGHGLIHPYLKENAEFDIDIHGIDPASTVIDFARERHGSFTYAVNEGTSFPYEDDSFDVAKATCVMHHVDPSQWECFLREMKRVVKPGGLIFIYEHNPYNPMTRRLVNTCELDENAVLISAPDLERRMKNIGLSCVKTDYIIFFPFDLSVFRKIETAITWLPLGAQYTTYAVV